MLSDLNGTDGIFAFACYNRGYKISYPIYRFVPDGFYPSFLKFNQKLCKSTTLLRTEIRKCSYLEKKKKNSNTLTADFFVFFQARLALEPKC